MEFSQIIDESVVRNGVKHVTKKLSFRFMNLGVATDSGLTVQESIYFLSRKHSAFLLVLTLPWTFIWSLLNQRHGEEHDSVPG